MESADNTSQIVERLKRGKSAKTQRSLDHLNSTLEKYHNSGARDFSITTIGRVSAENGGVGYQSIRKTTNAHYRCLIEGWAAKANASLKKPSRVKDSGASDRDLLDLIPDVTLRTRLSLILQERDWFRIEAKRFKAQAEIIIDNRPTGRTATETEPNPQILPSLRELVQPSELKALQYACSAECAESNEWTVSEQGQVRDSLGRELLPRGFVTGLRKILGESYEQ